MPTFDVLDVFGADQWNAWRQFQTTFLTPTASNAGRLCWLSACKSKIYKLILADFSAPMFLRIVISCLWLHQLPRAMCHGYLSSPKSRNLLASEELGFNCPHCLNVGGVQEMSAGGSLQWPRGLRTMTGDPVSAKSPRRFEAGGDLYTGAVTGNYTQGSVIPIEVVLTTNHNGRFDFRICKVRGGYDTAAQTEAKSLTEECLNENVLLQADVEGAQMPGQRYFYTLVEDARQSVTYQMYYELPKGLDCDGIESHCVLQWYWLTFNSCQTSDAPVRYTRASNNMANCDDQGASYPEQFINVADIVITPDPQGSVSKERTAAFRDRPVLPLVFTLVQIIVLCL